MTSVGEGQSPPPKRSATGNAPLAYASAAHLENEPVAENADFETLSAGVGRFDKFDNPLVGNDEHRRRSFREFHGRCRRLRDAQRASSKGRTLENGRPLRSQDSTTSSKNEATATNCLMRSSARVRRASKTHNAVGFHWNHTTDKPTAYGCEGNGAKRRNTHNHSLR